MGLALVTDAGTIETTSAATLYAAPAGVGSSLTVRNSALASPVYLTDMWRKAVTTAGQIQIISPKVVPISHGIQFNCPIGVGDFLMYGPPYQILTPQDTLAMSLSGGATEKVVGCIQSYYKELAGASMTLKMPGDIAGQTEFVFGWEVAVTSSATFGAQNQTVITTTYDGSTANRWYAVLGYVTSVSLAAVGISGVDTSNMFIGGPGDIVTKNTTNYFADLSTDSGMPCIPLFNAANKSNTFVTVIDSAASTAAKVTLVLAELNASYQP